MSSDEVSDVVKAIFVIALPNIFVYFIISFLLPAISKKLFMYPLVQMESEQEDNKEVTKIVDEESFSLANSKSFAFSKSMSFNSLIEPMLKSSDSDLQRVDGDKFFDQMSDSSK